METIDLLLEVGLPPNKSGSRRDVLRLVRRRPDGFRNLKPNLFLTRYEFFSFSREASSIAFILRQTFINTSCTETGHLLIVASGTGLLSDSV